VAKFGIERNTSQIIVLDRGSERVLEETTEKIEIIDKKNFFIKKFIKITQPSYSITNYPSLKYLI